VSRVTVEPVAGGVWRAAEHRDGRCVVSAGIVAVGDGTVVFDTLESAEAGAVLRERAEAIGPVTLAALSHRHGDHAGGLAAFADVPVVATAETRAALDGTAPGRGARAALDGTAPGRAARAALDGKAPAPVRRRPPPALALDGTLTIQPRDRAVQLLACGRAHTAGDLVLFVPDERVLFTGDVVVNGLHPRLRDGPPASWLRVLDRLVRLRPRHVVPGHGEPCDREAIDRVAAYLRALERGVAEPLPGCDDHAIHAANQRLARGARIAA
jgi:cyclase